MYTVMCRYTRMVANADGVEMGDEMGDGRWDTTATTATTAR